MMKNERTMTEAAFYQQLDIAISTNHGCFKVILQREENFLPIQHYWTFSPRRKLETYSVLKVTLCEFFLCAAEFTFPLLIWGITFFYRHAVYLSSQMSEPVEKRRVTAVDSATCTERADVSAVVSWHASASLVLRFRKWLLRTSFSFPCEPGVGFNWLLVVGYFSPFSSPFKTKVKETFSPSPRNILPMNTALYLKVSEGLSVVNGSQRKPDNACSKRYGIMGCLFYMY